MKNINHFAVGESPLYEHVSLLKGESPKYSSLNLIQIVIKAIILYE